MTRAMLVAVILVMCSPDVARAQACTDADAAATVGRAVIDTDDARFNADALRLLRTRAPGIATQTARAMAMVLGLLARPIGADVRLSRSPDVRSLTGASLARATVVAGVFGYHCVPSAGYAPSVAGRVRLGTETGTWIRVYFNSLGPLVGTSRAVTDLRTERGALIFYAPRQHDTMRGVSVVRPAVTPGREAEAVVLTVDGRSPWVPFTRDALLGARIAALRARLDTVRRIPQASGLLGALERDIAILQTVREGMTPADRALQAVVKNPYAAPTELFVSEPDGGTPLVMVDRSLLRRGATADAVHLITVVWEWQPSRHAEAALVRQFRAQIDLNAWRGMLSW